MCSLCCGAGSAKTASLQALAYTQQDAQCVQGASEQPGHVMQSQVRKDRVIDYNTFVAPEDEMWLERIKKTLTKTQYSSRQAFQDDVHQIAKNARAYNSNKQAVCAYPGKLLFVCIRSKVAKDGIETAHHTISKYLMTDLHYSLGPSHANPE